MNKNKYFTEEDFLGFLSEHGLTADVLPEEDEDTEIGYNQFPDPEHTEKQITFISRTILPDEDEENEKE